MWGQNTLYFIMMCIVPSNSINFSKYSLGYGVGIGDTLRGETTYSNKKMHSAIKELVNLAISV